MPKGYLLTNIKCLYQCSPGDKILKGKEMESSDFIEDAFLLTLNSRIEAYGPMSELDKDNLDLEDIETLNAEGKYVLPGFIDSHTHLVFAESREGEFVDRINGLSYQEIAQKGGGILNSARKLANKSEDDLYEDAVRRLSLLMEQGTAAIEIKSGYGLSKEAEYKMLKVIARLKREFDIPIKATFLAAHAVPEEYKGRRKEYVKLLSTEWLPEFHKEKLIDYVDIFCEDGYFDTEDCETLFIEAQKLGLKIKFHVNQFNSIGGIELLKKYDVLSVDHMEVMSEKDLEILSQQNTIVCALPSCSFFLSIPYTDLKSLKTNEIAYCLASDFNPGSTPSGNLQQLWSIACIKMGITPIEALNALTINASHALEIENELGSIKTGKRASFIVTDNVPSLNYIPYSFGEDNFHTIFINGKIWHQNHGTF